MTVRKFSNIVSEYNSTLDRPLRFLQLGCNDGLMADPVSEMIIDNQWNGIFVDADSFYLQQAMSFYSQANPEMCNSREWLFVNAGIITEQEKLEATSPFKKFFSIVPDAIRPLKIEQEETGAHIVYGDLVFFQRGLLEDMDPLRNNLLDYLQGIGSFDYNFVLDHIKKVTEKEDESGKIARKVFTEDDKEHPKFVQMKFVPQQTVNDLLSYYPFPEIDLLQTDLEHWDVKVLADLESFCIKPKLIHFEAANGVDSELRGVFEKCGYDLIKTDRDHMAILK